MMWTRQRTHEHKSSIFRFAFFFFVSHIQLSMLPLLVRFIRLLSIGIEIKLSLSELVMSDNCDMNGAK